MRESTNTVYEWGLRTFGRVRDPAVYIGRALEEFAELVNLIEFKDDAGEYAVTALKDVAEEIKQEGSIRYASAEDVAEEVADVRIVLEHVLGFLGYDGQVEVDKKMAKNRRREWKTRGDGTGQHA